MVEVILPNSDGPAKPNLNPCLDNFQTSREAGHTKSERCEACRASCQRRDAVATQIITKRVPVALYLGSYMGAIFDSVSQDETSSVRMRRSRCQSRGELRSEAAREQESGRSLIDSRTDCAPKQGRRICIFSRSWATKRIGSSSPQTRLTDDRG